MQDFFKDCFCNRETFFKFVRKNKCVKRIVYFLIFILAISAFSCGKSKEKVITIEKDLKIIPFGRFSRAFNDMNDRHLEAARRLGISPASSREEALSGNTHLCEITDCEYYKVDSLTHSIPYLVPKAKELLETIGKNFIDSLESRGGGSYQILVTSVLRVDQDVKRLRKKNGNASANSAHRYGTTFDIAYSRFVTTDDRYLTPKEQLKHILAEVLLSLKKRNACYVKYEIKQGCFHVTVR